MSFRRIAPIERMIEDASRSFSKFLYEERLQGATYARLAEVFCIHRSTARTYARTYEVAARRYKSGSDRAPSCNELRLLCAVCDEPFSASRGDARHCSNACRQDAYRHRRAEAA